MAVSRGPSSYQNEIRIGRVSSLHVSPILFLVLLALFSFAAMKNENNRHKASSFQTEDQDAALWLYANMSSPTSFDHPFSQPEISPRPQWQRRAKARTIHSMKEAFQLAKARLYEKLKEDYGDKYFGQIFIQDGVSRGRSYFVSPSGSDGISTRRMVRKFAIKLLTILVENKEDMPFVWVAGGHSAAAGHGNLFSENYMAVFERNGRDLFRSVGLALKGKNYAMGGTSSGREVGSCIQSIFGTDFDILSWDYGMTDGSQFDLLRSFCYRAAVHVPTRPACLAYTSNARAARGRTNQLQILEAAGATVLKQDAAAFERYHEDIPDTAEIGDLSKIQAMPKFVQSFRCGRQLEKGEPTCDKEKYSKSGNPRCDNRKFRVSWHPGWKFHALQGNFKVLCMMEFIEDALELISKSGSDPTVLLKQLKGEDDTDFYRLKNDPQFDPIVEKAPCICHTALLPAEIRYQGILTATSDETGTEGYHKGIESGAGSTLSLDNAPMPLVYESRERQPGCTTVLQVDYKDYFVVWGSYKGYSTITIPNAAEKKAYMTPSQVLNGTIAVCLKRCDWGKCPFNDVRDEHFNQDNGADIQVNGVKVTNMSKFGNDCAFLEGPQGRHSWRANDQGQFIIGVHVTQDKNYMRWSSVILW